MKFFGGIEYNELISRRLIEKLILIIFDEVLLDDSVFLLKEHKNPILSNYHSDSLLLFFEKLPHLSLTSAIFPSMLRTPISARPDPRGPTTYFSFPFIQKYFSTLGRCMTVSFLLTHLLLLFSSQAVMPRFFTSEASYYISVY